MLISFVNVLAVANSHLDYVDFNPLISQLLLLLVTYK